MASPASALSSSGLRIKFFGSRRCQLQSSLSIHTLNQPISSKSSVKLPTVAQLHEPTKFMVHINKVREELWEVTPHSVKDFPWKKAKNIVLKQLLVFGREALKCSLLALFPFSFVSDVIYSIARNRELMIPVGIFVGCILADFLNEISQELFPIREERNFEKHLLGIGCFFAFIKVISIYFLVPARFFLLHASNGGLMQVLWLWKSSMEKQDRESKDNSMLEDASSTIYAED
ncbi:hypothetical protein NMG60_11031270 [Bertholletia excelsa]